MRFAPEKYEAIFQRGGDYWGSYSYATSQVRTMPIPVDVNEKPIYFLLGGFILFAGIGGYLLFKKLDKREWLWLYMPALAICCCVALYAISLTGEFDAPLAASFTRLAIDENGGEAVTTSVAFNCKETSERVFSVSGGGVLSPTDEDNDSYYYYDQQTFPKVPDELRYRHILGLESAVGFPAESAWTPTSATVESGMSIEGAIEATSWVEDDGLHGTIVNDSAYPLSHCAVFTSFGFQSLGDMSPGDKRDFAITQMSDEEAEMVKAASQDDDYQIALDGRLTRQIQFTQDFYAEYSYMIDSYCYPEAQREPSASAREAILANIAPDEKSERSLRKDLLTSVCGQWYDYGQNQSPLQIHFIGFNEQLGKMVYSINGAPIERSVHMGLVDARVKYLPVGATGTVYYLPNQIPAQGAVLEGNVPAIDPDWRPRQSYRLSDQPLFAFELPDAGDINIDEVTISVSYFDETPRTQLYNRETREWDDQNNIHLTLKGDKIAPYIDQNGRLFVRYFEGAGRMAYSEMYTPTIAIRGSVKNAEM